MYLLALITISNFSHYSAVVTRGLHLPAFSYINSSQTDALLDSQLAAGETISKAWRITVKLGKDNLSIEILQSRLALLEAYWKEYVERHQQIFSDRAALKEEDYFTQDLYSDIEC